MKWITDEWKFEFGQWPQNDLLYQFIANIPKLALFSFHSKFTLSSIMKNEVDESGREKWDCENNIGVYYTFKWNTIIFYVRKSVVLCMNKLTTITILIKYNLNPTENPSENH